MAKTYNTISSVSTGDVYTATQHNSIVTNVNNYRVPPAVEVYRTSRLSSYSSLADITWEAAARINTDGMWSSGATITIQTAGIYLISFVGLAAGTATITDIYPVIRKNSANFATFHPAIRTSSDTRFNCQVVCSLAAGDTIQARVGFTGGSAYFIEGGATEGENQTRLSLTWLGQVS